MGCSGEYEHLKMRLFKYGHDRPETAGGSVTHYTFSFFFFLNLNLYSAYSVSEKIRGVLMTLAYNVRD
jgi:hypothetical protein